MRLRRGGCRVLTGNTAVASAYLASHPEAVLFASWPLIKIHRVWLGDDADALSRYSAAS